MSASLLEPTVELYRTVHLILQSYMRSRRLWDSRDTL